MDHETLTLLSESVAAWSKDNQRLIHDIETRPHTPSNMDDIFAALNAMGLLNVLGESDTRNEMQAVAEIAFQLARYSPSLAVMAVQQNLACWLLAESNAAAPCGWVALPLFDAVAEWAPSPLRVASAEPVPLTGRWSNLPLLTNAKQVLLPLNAHGAAPFALIALTLVEAGLNGIQISAPLKTLGLRGCPQGDLQLHQVQVSSDQVIAQGQKAFAKLEALWSQAEICMMAIRSGIADSCYSTARDYAQQRYQGGKIIIRHSLIRKMLADLYREKCVIDDQWRSMAATLRPETKLSDGQLGMALNSGKTLPSLTSDGIQLLGGVGYMEDYPQERRFRDAKHCEFLLGHPQARNFSLWKSEVEYHS